MNEYLSRYQVFKMNFIETSLKLSSSYKTGITKFSDLTFQEFSKIYLNLDYNFMAFQKYSTVDIKITNGVPDSYDWRENGRVSEVKDQLSCGSVMLLLPVVI